MSARPRLTHVAFPVRDIDASTDFYRRYASLHLVHQRTDKGKRVVWMSEQQDDPSFVFVFIESPTAGSPGPALTRHLGYDLPSREAVDEIARRGAEAGVLVQEPTYAGKVVGYFCMLRDPDGNIVEFSHGQPIHPRDLE